MDTKQQVAMLRFFFSAHGIVLNETNLFFAAGRWTYKAHEFDQHLSLMVDALKFAVGKYENPPVEVIYEKTKVVIKIGDSEALVYQRGHWFDAWVCKRSEPYSIKVSTVIFGDTAGALLDILVNSLSSIRSGVNA